MVPARAGSKGIPGKNTKIFRDAPLVNWSFAAAKWLSNKLDAQVLCTTDDPKVAELARAMNLLVHNRAKQLANDTASMADVVLDVCEATNSNNYILLQPTSPLRIKVDLERLVSALEKNPTVVSCTTPAEAPEDIIELSSGPIITGPKTETRQERVREYRFVDGAFYAGCVKNLENGLGFSPTGTKFVTLTNPIANDIDTPFDWTMAETQHDWLVSQGVEFVRP